MICFCAPIRVRGHLRTPSPFLRAPAGEPFSLGSHFPTSLPASFWQRLICPFTGRPPAAKRNNPHVQRLFQRGAGWREEGRASCQQPRGQGEAWEGHSGAHGWGRRAQEEPLGERGGVPGPLGNNKDGRSRGTEGRGGGFQPEREGRREWLEAVEARRERRRWGRRPARPGAAPLCTSFLCFHSSLTDVVAPGAFLRLPVR